MKIFRRPSHQETLKIELEQVKYHLDAYRGERLRLLLAVEYNRAMVALYERQLELLQHEQIPTLTDEIPSP